MLATEGPQERCRLNLYDKCSKAEHHGLMSTAKLVEYAAFIVSGTIKLKPMIVPNFHFYLHEEFIERWTAANVQVGTT